MSLSTHVLDVHRGRPAAHVAVELDRDEAGIWETLNAMETDDDGRIRELLADGENLEPGMYCLRFATAAYFERMGDTCLYPIVEITFTVRPGETHYHIPLLLTANGYQTYRGS